MRSSAGSPIPILFMCWWMITQLRWQGHNVHVCPSCQDLTGPCLFAEIRYERITNHDNDKSTRAGNKTTCTMYAIPRGRLDKPKGQSTPFASICPRAAAAFSPIAIYMYLHVGISRRPCCGFPHPAGLNHHDPDRNGR